MTHFTWTHGGDVWFVTMQGDAITVESSVSSPPGSRREFAGDGRVIKMKVHGCKKLDTAPSDPTRYRIEGRTVDMTRPLRDYLMALIAVAPKD